MNIGELARSVEQENIPDVIPLFELLSNDVQDYVRIVTIDHMHDIAEIAPNNETLISLT